MSGRMSSAVWSAMRHYQMRGGNVYRIAARFKIAPSSLYRALKPKGKKKP